MLITMVVVTAITGPKVLPIKVINEPVDGMERENSARVLPSRAIAMAAVIMVSGEPMPAAEAINAELKKKLIAGATFAIVDVEMSTRCKAPRWRRGTPAAASVFPSTSGACGDSSCMVIADSPFKRYPISGAFVCSRLRRSPGRCGCEKMRTAHLFSQPHLPLVRLRRTNGPREKAMAWRTRHPLQ